MLVLNALNKKSLKVERTYSITLHIKKRLEQKKETNLNTTPGAKKDRKNGQRKSDEGRRASNQSCWCLLGPNKGSGLQNLGSTLHIWRVLPENSQH